MKRRAADGGLRATFRTALPHIHWVTVESAMTEGGIPDANGCYAGREFWVEYKWTAGTAVTMRPLQVGWHLRRARAGGVSFIAVRRHCEAGARREAADELWLFAGADAKRLAIGGLAGARPLGRWAGGSGAWPWRAVEKALIGGGRSPRPA